MTGEQAPSAEFSSDRILDIKDSLQFSLWPREAALLLCKGLEATFPNLPDKAIKVTCGAEYLVGDGQSMGANITTSDEWDRRPNSGLTPTGIFKRFDVYEVRDELMGRGTEITVFEPCIVFTPDRPGVHRTEMPEVIESYVPIIRLENIELVED